MASAQSKEVTPSTEDQLVIPDSGYEYLDKVTTYKIPYQEVENDFGTTIIIAGAPVEGSHSGGGNP